MDIDSREGATRYLGAPKDWVPEENGVCSHLAILDASNDLGDAVMISAWEPTPAELAALNSGAKVYLSIWGVGHPPVALFVQ
jgi:hypothetical protein